MDSRVSLNPDSEALWGSSIDPHLRAGLMRRHRLVEQVQWSFVKTSELRGWQVTETIDWVGRCDWYFVKERKSRNWRARLVLGVQSHWGTVSLDDQVKRAPRYIRPGEIDVDMDYMSP